MRRAAKVDTNQSEIVAALRQAGASVQLLHQVGKGCPDLLCGFRRQSFVLEVKSGNADLTPDELRWFAEWRGQAAIVRTPEEALQAIGALRTTAEAMGKMR